MQYGLGLAEVSPVLPGSLHMRLLDQTSRRQLAIPMPSQPPSASLLRPPWPTSMPSVINVYIVYAATTGSHIHARRSSIEFFLFPKFR